MDNKEVDNGKARECEFCNAWVLRTVVLHESHCPTWDKSEDDEYGG